MTSMKLEFLDSQSKQSQKSIDLMQAEIETLEKQSRRRQASIDALQATVESLQKRGFLDRMFPIGSLHMTFADVQPPMNGKDGVQWELLPEGYALVTAHKGNVGTSSGGERLDNGGTNGHVLSEAEMPTHSHGYEHGHWTWAKYHGGGRFLEKGLGTHQTSSSGGNQAHSHRLNVMNQKVIVWKRTS